MCCRWALASIAKYQNVIVGVLILCVATDRRTCIDHAARSGNPPNRFEHVRVYG